MKIKELREHLQLHVPSILDVVNREIPIEFRYLKRKERSFFDHLSKFEDKTQESVSISTRIARLIEEAFEEAFVSLAKYRRDFSFVRTNTSGYDFIIDGAKWELKTTRMDTFHGSNSSSKVNNYILLKYDLDEFVPVTRVRNYIDTKNFFLFCGIMDNVYWDGERTDSSSWTTLRVPVEDAYFLNEGLIQGRLVTRDKRQYKHIRFGTEREC